MAVHHHNLARLLIVVSIAGFAMSGLMFLAGMQLDSWLLIAGAGCALGVGLFMRLAADSLEQGKERRGALHLTIALLFGAAAYTIVLPGGASHLALLPVILVAVVLPFVQGAALTRTLIAAWLLGFTMVAVNILWLPPTQLPFWFTTAFRALGFAAILALTLSILAYHHRRLTATVDQAQNDARALQQAHVKLQQSDQVKTRFLNSAAHELRTPLTPIMIQMNLVKHHPAVQQDERLTNNLEIIDRNLHRLKSHVDELLDIARLRSDRFPLRLQDTPLDPLLQDAEASFREVTKEKGIRFDVRGAPGILLHADPPRVMQVLFNLLSNAVKATPPGGRIVVMAEHDDETCTIRVVDTGHGIPPEEKDRLFQPFGQLTEQEAEATGAGLGLFISQTIVQAHGGTLTCESPGVGQGATFTVTIPLAQSDPRPHATTPPHEEPTSHPRSATKAPA